MTPNLQTKPAILIVDDESATCNILSRFLQKDYNVTIANSGEEAQKAINIKNFNAVITDLRMEHGDGLSVLAKCREMTPPIPCIVVTAYGSIETAVDAIRKGAYDFITKPVNFDQLEIILQRLMTQENLKNENKELKQQLKRIERGHTPMLGNSKAITNVIQLVRQVAPTHATVLITGESGTGKELVAEMLHKYAERPGPFVPIHCAALPEQLLESELFGHERGAFTGAIEQHKGFFETATNGTLFLDEIGEISPAVQVKLLRVLESQTFTRIGGTTQLKTHARIIAATNRSLAEMVREGTFREDLFFRLDVVRIMIPPLRARKEDIPLLVRYWLNHFAKENHRDTLDINEEALVALSEYDWPGNVRELRNCIERMVVLSREDILTLDNVPRNVRLREGSPLRSPKNAKLGLSDKERETIVEALELCNGNRTRAAEKLGISRRTLQRKLIEYKINL